MFTCVSTQVQDTHSDRAVSQATVCNCVFVGCYLVYMTAWLLVRGKRRCQLFSNRSRPSPSALWETASRWSDWRKDYDDKMALSERSLHPLTFRSVHSKLGHPPVPFSHPFTHSDHPVFSLGDDRMALSEHSLHCPPSVYSQLGRAPCSFLSSFHSFCSSFHSDCLTLPWAFL